MANTGNKQIIQENFQGFSKIKEKNYFIFYVEK